MDDDYDPEIPEDGENPCREPQKFGLYFYFAIALLGCLAFMVVFVNVPAIQATAGNNHNKDRLAAPVNCQCERGEWNRWEAGTSPPGSGTGGQLQRVYRLQHLQRNVHHEQLCAS